MVDWEKHASVERAGEVASALIDECAVTVLETSEFWPPALDFTVESRGPFRRSYPRSPRARPSAPRCRRASAPR